VATLFLSVERKSSSSRGVAIALVTVLDRIENRPEPVRALGWLQELRVDLSTVSGRDPFGLFFARVLAATGHGRAVVAWRTPSERLAVALMHGGELLGRPRIISPRNKEVSNPTIGIDRAGEPIVAWEATGSNPNINWLRVAVGDQTGEFRGSIRFINTHFFSMSPALGVARDGLAVVAWLVYNQIHAAVRAPGRAHSARNARSALHASKPGSTSTRRSEPETKRAHPATRRSTTRLPVVADMTCPTGGRPPGQCVHSLLLVGWLRTRRSK
jgi:hypothetical protein